MVCSKSRGRKRVRTKLERDLFVQQSNLLPSFSLCREFKRNRRVSSSLLHFLWTLNFTSFRPSPQVPFKGRTSLSLSLSSLHPLSQGEENFFSRTSLGSTASENHENLKEDQTENRYVSPSLLLVFLPFLSLSLSHSLLFPGQENFFPQV